MHGKKVIYECEVKIRHSCGGFRPVSHALAIGTEVRDLAKPPTFLRSGRGVSIIGGRLGVSERTELARQQSCWVTVLGHFVYA